MHDEHDDMLLLGFLFLLLLMFAKQYVNMQSNIK